MKPAPLCPRTLRTVSRRLRRKAADLAQLRSVAAVGNATVSLQHMHQRRLEDAHQLGDELLHEAQAIEKEREAKR